MPTREEFKASVLPVLRGTALGSLLGVLPGGGALLASFGSYSIEKRFAKDPSRFGKGAIEGVAGPEAANNAGAQTSFIPMLTLGIPVQRRDGADGRRHDHSGHHAGSGFRQQAACAVLGRHRIDVDRQCDAGDPQPADDRIVGEAAHVP